MRKSSTGKTIIVLAVYLAVSAATYVYGFNIGDSLVATPTIVALYVEMGIAVLVLLCIILFTKDPLDGAKQAGEASSNTGKNV